MARQSHAVSRESLLQHLEHVQARAQHPCCPALLSTPETGVCSHCFLLRHLAFNPLLQCRAPMHPHSSIRDKPRLTPCLKKCFFPRFAVSRGGEHKVTPRTGTQIKSYRHPSLPAAGLTLSTQHPTFSKPNTSLMGIFRSFIYSALQEVSCHTENIPHTGCSYLKFG